MLNSASLFGEPDPKFKLQLETQNHPIRTCFSLFSFSTNEIGTLSVCATISAGLRASHCVSEMSATRSDLYISIQTRSSVSDVFSM
jgi:hypothetical protein